MLDVFCVIVFGLTGAVFSTTPVKFRRASFPGRLYRQPAGIDQIHWLVQYIGVAIPTFRTGRSCAGHQRICRSKSTLGRREISCPEIIQAAFCVSLLAGELISDSVTGAVTQRRCASADSGANLNAERHVVVTADNIA